MKNNSVLDYSQDQILFAQFAKALSHPARIKILGILYDSSPKTCGELVDYLPLSQPSVSQHLLELKKAGLIFAEQAHPKVSYYFDKNSFEIGVRIFKNMILKDMFDKHIKSKLEL